MARLILIRDMMLFMLRLSLASGITLEFIIVAAFTQACKFFLCMAESGDDTHIITELSFKLTLHCSS